jgi:membrane protein YqaA with SNARE-associated domain
MKLFEPIYSSILRWAKHKHAERYLAGISFAEASFFPIPVDVMLAPMVLSAPRKAWRLAVITTVMSVLGACFGYFIGAFLFDSFGAQILDFFGAQHNFDVVQGYFVEYGMLIILIAGFSPVPFKIFTIASGVASIAFLPFVLMCVISRGARYLLVAGLVKLGGEKLESTLHKKIEMIGWGFVALVGVGLAVYLALF